MRTSKWTALAFCLVAAAALSVSVAKADTLNGISSITLGMQMGSGIGTPCQQGPGDPACTGENFAAPHNPDYVIANQTDGAGHALANIWYQGAGSTNPNLPVVYLIFGAGYQSQNPLDPNCYLCAPAGGANGINPTSFPFNATVTYYDKYLNVLGAGAMSAPGSGFFAEGTGLASKCNNGTNTFFCGNFDLSTNGTKSPYEVLGLASTTGVQGAFTLGKAKQAVEWNEQLPTPVTGITGFSMYVYQLTLPPSGSLPRGGFIGFNFGNFAPPNGSFATAYGCTNIDSGSSNERCKESQISNMLIMPATPPPPQVPEPGSLILLGTGLLGLGSKLRSKFRS